MKEINSKQVSKGLDFINPVAMAYHIAVSMRDKKSSEYDLDDIIGYLGQALSDDESDTEEDNALPCHRLCDPIRIGEMISDEQVGNIYRTLPGAQLISSNITPTSTTRTLYSGYIYYTSPNIKHHVDGVYVSAGDIIVREDTGWLVNIPYEELTDQFILDMEFDLQLEMTHKNEFISPGGYDIVLGNKHIHFDFTETSCRYEYDDNESCIGAIAHFHCTKYDDDVFPGGDFYLIDHIIRGDDVQGVIDFYIDYDDHDIQLLKICNACINVYYRPTGLLVRSLEIPDKMLEKFTKL